MIRPVLTALACGLLASCAATTGTAAPGAAAAAPVPVFAGPIKGVHHIGITVSDIDDTLAFYSRSVPYELVERRMVDADVFPADVLNKRQGKIEIALVRPLTR